MTPTSAPPTPYSELEGLADGHSGAVAPVSPVTFSITKLPHDRTLDGADTAPHRPDGAAHAFSPGAAADGDPSHPTYIHGADDRHIYNDTTYPWGSVCRIDTAKGYGSGVLIGPRHVLTASHVIDWDNRWASVRVLAYDNGQRAQSNAIWLYWASQVRGETETLAQADDDFCVLVLDQNLGSQFGWLGTKTYNSSWDDDAYWANMGYADDVAGSREPLYQKPTSLNELALDFGAGRSMTFSGDLDFGQSGSPVFGFWNDGPHVVAICVCMGSGNNYCSGGTEMPDLVRKARAGHP